MPLDTARRQKSDRRAGQGIARSSIAVHRKGVAPAKHEAQAPDDTGETHIYFACPECQKRMRVRRALAGKRGVCPSCQARLVFPEGAADTSETETPPSAKKPSFSGLRNAVIGSVSAKPLPAAPVPARSPRVSGERLAIKASQARQPAVQPVSPAEPAPHSESQSESARVLAGTVLGLLVGIFAGFILGKNFATARENPAVAVQVLEPNVPREAAKSTGLAPREAANVESADLTPSITEKAPEPAVQVEPEPKRAVAAPVGKEPPVPEPALVKAPEPAPIEKTPEKAPSHTVAAQAQSSEAKTDERAAAPELAPAPAVQADEPEEKRETPAKVEPATKATAALAIQAEPPVAEPQASPEPQELAVPAVKEALAPAETQASPERPVSSQVAVKSEAAKPAAPGRRVFTTAREVHDYVDKRYQGDDGKYKLTLILVNKRGEERASQMVRYRHERDHLSKVLLTYVSPADVRGTTTMTIEQKDADDIQRIYIPSMKKNRRIASSDKGRSWAGTDFTYEDLQEHEVDDWNYGELKTDTVDGHECYLYVTTPVTPDKSCYSRIENWVRKDILEPVRAKYWDENGKYLKELNFRDLHKIQGIWSAMYWEMENVQEGHKTVFKVEKVIYNTGLKEDIFTPGSMVDVPLDF